jgi:hypothetical protein
MNDTYIFHIYILIIHYKMQLYNTRVRLASHLRAEPSSVRHRAASSRARLGSFPALHEAVTSRQPTVMVLARDEREARC